MTSLKKTLESFHNLDGPAYTAVGEFDADRSRLGLLNKSWHLYKISPMFGFETEDAVLSDYAKELAAHVAADIGFVWCWAFPCS